MINYAVLKRLVIGMQFGSFGENYFCHFLKIDKA